MHSIRPVSFCFRLFLISAAILVAVAVPTNHTLHEPSEDLCAVDARGLDMSILEDSVHCRFKLCEEKFGNKNGRTRNPDVINRIICAERRDECKQVYLTVEVVYTKGSRTTKRNETVPTGCLYSERDLRESVTVTAKEPSTVS